MSVYLLACVYLGDLLVQDDLGFFYFIDRLGDTFRWRGENVSTTEVENLVAKSLNFADCAVYGVKVPGNEGRAGMLALSLHDSKFLDNVKPEEKSITNEEAREVETLKDLSEVFGKQLPPYARPLFVRFMKQLDTTGAFLLTIIILWYFGIYLCNLHPLLRHFQV